MIRKLFFSSLLTAFVITFTIPVQAQFITIARKIRSSHTSKADVATVILDAKSFKVYKALIDTLTSVPKLKIISRDNVKRLVEFTYNQNTVSMQVDSLDKDLSQITVVAIPSENAPKQSTEMAVNAIRAACNKAGVKCTVQ
jgi:hypothetical protein